MKNVSAGKFQIIIHTMHQLTYLESIRRFLSSAALSPIWAGLVSHCGCNIIEAILDEIFIRSYLSFSHDPGLYLVNVLLVHQPQHPPHSNVITKPSLWSDLKPAPELGRISALFWSRFKPSLILILCSEPRLIPVLHVSFSARVIPQSSIQQHEKTGEEEILDAPWGFNTENVHVP